MPIIAMFVLHKRTHGSKKEMHSIFTKCEGRGAHFIRQWNQNWCFPVAYYVKLFVSHSSPHDVCDDTCRFLQIMKFTSSVSLKSRERSVAASKLAAHFLFIYCGCISKSFRSSSYTLPKVTSHLSGFIWTFFVFIRSWLCLCLFVGVSYWIPDKCWICIIKGSVWPDEEQCTSQVSIKHVNWNTS